MLTLVACRPNRDIAEYALKTRVQRHVPGEVSALHYQTLYKRHDRTSNSFLEIATYRYQGETKLVMASDVFNDYTRFNLLTGFYRQQYVDNREKVYSVVLNRQQCQDLVGFYNRLIYADGQVIEASSSSEEVSLDFSIAEDLFWNVEGIIMRTASVGTKGKLAIRWSSLWIKGRKHPINAHRFHQILSENLNQLN